LRLRKIYGFSVLFLVVAASAATCAAQDKPDGPTPKQSTAPATQSSPAEAPTNTSGQASDPHAQQDENPKRILGFIPNFQSKDDIPENQAPLTPREKYILAYHQTVDFSAHIGNAFQAALQQASNGQPHYGQGWGPTPSDSGQRKRTRSRRLFSYLAFCRMC